MAFGIRMKHNLEEASVCLSHVAKASLCFSCLRIRSASLPRNIIVCRIEDERTHLCPQRNLWKGVLLEAGFLFNSRLSLDGCDESSRSARRHSSSVFAILPALSASSYYEPNVSVSLC